MRTAVDLAKSLEARRLQAAPRSSLVADGRHIPVVAGEFWTHRQRQASSLHEVSYRACFKPQLPGFFIDLFTTAGDVVYDPFSGRGTTAVEAALRGRVPMANDSNPLSVVLTRPRLSPPTVEEVAARLGEIPTPPGAQAGLDLSMFFHPATESELVGVRRWLLERSAAGVDDPVDAWIRMVATNRLTGHSPGFFSVYTLPPNQAASAASQRRINATRRQEPTYRDVRRIILRKTRSLLRGVSEAERRHLSAVAGRAQLLTEDARATPQVPSGSVALTVTSPPFLDIVQYAKDNWLRCWFNGIDAAHVGDRITMARTPQAWSAFLRDVFAELRRVTRPGGWVAFEVGEVRRGTIRLEEHVVPAAAAARWVPEAVVVNDQSFTKTANIWGVRNNRQGTNTNRIVLLHRA